MNDILVMGSCRVVKTLMDCNNVKTYSGGHIHTTTDILQAYDIMTGRLLIPKNLKKYVFDGWGNIPNKLMEPESNILIIEISSNKNYTYKNINLHIGYEDFIERNEVSKLDNVIVSYESENQIKNNLTEIKNKYKCKKMIVVSHNNISCLPNRYFLSYVLSSWCKENNEIFIDPTVLIAQYGIDKTLVTPVKWVLEHNLHINIDGNDYDPQHFTDFMIEKLRDKLIMIGENKND